MTKKTFLCEKCESYVVGMLNELLVEAKAFGRGSLIQDAIIDLWCCLEEGNLNRVRERDRKRKAGVDVPRRLTPNQAL